MKLLHILPTKQFMVILLTISLPKLITQLTMGFHNLIQVLLPLLFLPHIFALNNNMVPMNCSSTINNCDAFLYHINNGLNPNQVASLYNVKPSKVFPISRAGGSDYLVSITSSCKNINGTTAYFYDVPYLVKQNDTFFNVSTEIYGGQVWEVGDEEQKFVAGNVVSLHVLTGCLDKSSQVVGTYTVEQSDSITDIAARLSSSVDGIMRLNSGLIQNQNFLVVGWVLFVPMDSSLAVVPSPSPSP